jgi:hypothetical protein
MSKYHLVDRTNGTVGQVHWVVAVPFTLSWLASAAFTGASAGVDQLGNTSKILWAVMVLQIILFLLLALRGIFDALQPVFKMVSVQMLLLFHTITPNLLITSLWVARSVIDSVVKLPAGSHEFQGKDYTLLTIAMVFSNIYSGFAMSMVMVNSAFFMKPMADMDGLLKV